MMQNDSNVRGALIQAAQTFLTSGKNTIPDSAIVWENRISTAAEDHSLWASVFYRPNQPFARTIGQCGIDEVDGFLQIDFNIPQGKGEDILLDWENEARQFFAPGNRFFLDGVYVLVTASGMLQGSIINNYFRKSYQVNFKADLNRQTNRN